MAYASIDDLRSQLGGKPKAELSPEYREKMLHEIPKTATEVKRNEFILKHCTDKRVYELGASGPMHEQIKMVAKSWFGIDREDQPDGVQGFDLDDVKQDSLPAFDPEIIVLGEVLEHLSNPGWVLTRLKRQFPGVPVIVTVPNAGSFVTSKWLTKGFENVNKDHVAWYSPKTISVLLQRAGYTVGGLFWYNGSGPTAEGLVVVTE